MRILVTDLWPKEAHRPINTMILYSIARYAQVTVVSINGYYDIDKEKFKKENISCIDVLVKERSGRIGTRLFCMELQNKTQRLLTHGDYDCVLCMSYETTCLPLSNKLYSEIPTILCEHSNLDDLQNRFKRAIAKELIKKCYHLVFEDAFKQWMIEELRINSEKIYVVPHPITLEHDDVKANTIYDCIGLCHANDDHILNDIVGNCKKYEDSGLKVVFRSNKVKSSSDSIIIINKYLSREQYRSFYRDTKHVFVATPENYKNRLSASIYDAISYDKVAYTTNKTLSKLYENRYPGVCVYISSENELYNLLTQGSEDNSELKESFERFKREHSKDMLDIQVKDMIMSLYDELHQNRSNG